MSSDHLVVLDAWPVVEYFSGNEPSVAKIEALLADDSTVAVMSSVNYAEAYSAIAAKTLDFAVADNSMRSLKLFATAKMVWDPKHRYGLLRGPFDVLWCRYAPVEFGAFRGCVFNALWP